MEERRYELTSSEWNRIKRMLSPEHPKSGQRGRPAKYDNRRIINGILWLAGSGAPWRELPERYGKWQAASARFRLWKQRGIFEAIFAALSADADMENLSIDFTSRKVHQSANGRGKTPEGGKKGSNDWHVQRRQQYENSRDKRWFRQSAGVPVQSRQ